MALFRRKKKVVEESVTESNIAVAAPEENEDGTVSTALTYHSDWYMSPQEKYIYQFHHQQLPNLLPNQISITGIKLEPYDDDLFVIAFLRNTLQKSVKFETVDLLILDEENKPVAKQTFEMDDLVELPPLSCMPWRFLFTEESKLSDKIPAKDGWKIAFELKSKANALPHRLDLETSWEDQISTIQREQLEKLVAGLPKLSPGEVNFMGIEAKRIQENALAVTVLIRNGSEKNIQLEQIPLIVEDADGDVICQGGFKLENFEVKANTSKPWTFIFPAQLVTKAEPNLSAWKVYPPSK